VSHTKYDGARIGQHDVAMHDPHRLGSEAQHILGQQRETSML